MQSNFSIRSLTPSDISTVTEFARREGFAPGIEDVYTYRNTDKQGLWIGWLGEVRVGCIVGVKYNERYGFLGLFIVDKIYRGKGYGISLWKHVLNELSDLECIGLEAAPDRLGDYSKWGFEPSSTTTRWLISTDGQSSTIFNNPILNVDGLMLLYDSEITEEVIQEYDANKESTPRPHFLSDWLFNHSGLVLSIIDKKGKCVGFGRIRRCLLKRGLGWRIGPLIADNVFYAEVLLRSLLLRHPGEVLIDSPGLNPLAEKLMNTIGFKPISHTVRMYKGIQPKICMTDIYGLACLELG